MTMVRKIANAYEAYHFLNDHPAFLLRERVRVSPSRAKKLAARGYIVTTDRNGKCWREFRHHHKRAMDSNLSVYYAMVNKRGVVGKDKKRNTNVECWLEFGKLAYEYPYEGAVETTLHEYHDYELDVGAPTYDEALVKLANRVLQKHGDYKNDRNERQHCGGPASCGDCREIDRHMARLMGPR